MTLPVPCPACHETPMIRRAEPKKAPPQSWPIFEPHEALDEWLSRLRSAERRCCLCIGKGPGGARWQFIPLTEAAG